MHQQTARFVRGLLAMGGTVIGAGIFALPATFQRTGILAGSIAYWCAALAVLATNLFYVDVVLRTKQSGAHRFPMQAGDLLGVWVKRVACITYPAQIIGASLVYMILGGTFLSVLARAVGFTAPLVAWQLFFWAAGAFVVARSLSFVSAVESKIFSVLLCALLIASGFFIISADLATLTTAHWSAIGGSLSIFLFALFGWEVIPEVAVLTAHHPVRTRVAVGFGSAAAALVMWMFGVFAYAAIGDSVSAGIEGLVQGFSPVWHWVFPAIGLLAVSSPYLTLTEDLQTMFQTDIGLTKRTAWAVTFCAPLALFLMTARDFVATVSFMGGVFASCNGILICLMATAARFKRQKRVWQWQSVVATLCILFFALVLIRQLSLLVR